MGKAVGSTDSYSKGLRKDTHPPNPPYSPHPENGVTDKNFLCVANLYGTFPVGFKLFVFHPKEPS